MIFKLFDRFINYDTILKNLRDSKFARVHVHFEHEDFIKMKKQALFPIVGDETSIATSDRKLIETDLDSLRRKNLNTGSEDEFDIAANILINSLENSTLTSDRKTQKTPDVETQTEITRRRQRIIENINKDIINDNTVVGKNVVKTIDFDNKSLSITYKEFLLFNEITRIFILIDNVIRFVLPMIFFIIIGVIFSNETEIISAN